MVSPVSQVSSTTSTRRPRHDRGRPGDHHGPGAALLPGDRHRGEVALQDARDDRARDDARLGDADHELGVVARADLEGERAAQLAEERPVDLRARRRGLRAASGRARRRQRRRRGARRTWCGASRGKLHCIHDAAASYFRASWVFGADCSARQEASSSKPQRLDYLNEALALERQGDYDAALTSYRLALRDHPNDARILQNMAIAFTKTRRTDEAIRHYRRALELDAGARRRTLRARVPAAQARRPRRRRAAPARVPRATPQGTGRAEMDRARHAGSARPRVPRRRPPRAVGGGALRRRLRAGAGARLLHPVGPSLTRACMRDTRSGGSARRSSR